jgi:hypothetical protein
MTPTIGPTPVCNYAAGALQVPPGGASVFWDLTNLSGSSTIITAVAIPNWPGVPASQKVIGVNFGGVTIWEGVSSFPPTIITGGWSGTDADRTLASLESKTLELVFLDPIQSGFLDVLVRFSDGCILSESRP